MYPFLESSCGKWSVFLSELKMRLQGVSTTQAVKEEISSLFNTALIGFVLEIEDTYYCENYGHTESEAQQELCLKAAVTALQSVAKLIFKKLNDSSEIFKTCIDDWSTNTEQLLVDNIASIVQLDELEKKLEGKKNEWVSQAYGEDFLLRYPQLVAGLFLLDSDLGEQLIALMQEQVVSPVPKVVHAEIKYRHKNLKKMYVSFDKYFSGVTGFSGYQEYRGKISAERFEREFYQPLLAKYQELQEVMEYTLSYQRIRILSEITTLFQCHSDYFKIHPSSADAYITFFIPNMNALLNRYLSDLLPQIENEWQFAKSCLGNQIALERDNLKEQILSLLDSYRQIANCWARIQVGRFDKPVASAWSPKAMASIYDCLGFAEMQEIVMNWWIKTQSLERSTQRNTFGVLWYGDQIGSVKLDADVYFAQAQDLRGEEQFQMYKKATRSYSKILCAMKGNQEGLAKYHTEYIDILYQLGICYGKQALFTSAYYILTTEFRKAVSISLHPSEYRKLFIGIHRLLSMPTSPSLASLAQILKQGIEDINSQTDTNQAIQTCLNMLYQNQAHILIGLHENGTDRDDEDDYSNLSLCDPGLYQLIKDAYVDVRTAMCEYNAIITRAIQFVKTDQKEQAIQYLSQELPSSLIQKLSPEKRLEFKASEMGQAVLRLQSQQINTDSEQGVAVEQSNDLSIGKLPHANFFKSAAGQQNASVSSNEEIATFKKSC